MATESKNEGHVERLTDLFNSGPRIALDIEGIGKGVTKSGFPVFYLFRKEGEAPVMIYRNNYVGSVLANNIDILAYTRFRLVLEKEEKSGFTIYTVVEIKKLGYRESHKPVKLVDF